MTTSADLAARYALHTQASSQIDALLAALEAEADPPTTVRTRREALDVHIADSLVALELPCVRDARSIADLGAGAGFPGLALALALPEATVDLVESTGRKCEVIERLAAAAGIENARAIHARVEDWARADGAEAYDLVCARALARLPVLCEYAAPLTSLAGALVAWKGTRDPGEEAAGEAAAGLLGLEVGEVVAVRPFEASHSRHLHVYQKVRPTPARYPRRAGMATKRPLP